MEEFIGQNVVVELRSSFVCIGKLQWVFLGLSPVGERAGMSRVQSAPVVGEAKDA